MENIWQQLSKTLSGTTVQAGQSVLAVDGRSGHTSSGIFWRGDYVLTAAHTIRHESNIAVIFGPGLSGQARLAGSDPDTDIALLKLDREAQIRPAEFGDTASLAVGELVLAIARTRRGNLVASAGILGGLMGEWQVGRSRIDQFIRPDLNLYPGFSGGALIGADGKILGLNTRGLVRGKPIVIPAATLRRVGEELSTKGHVAKPYIGLVMQPVRIPETLQQRSGLRAHAGLLVMHVEPGGPADVAGVLLGDILLDSNAHAFDDLEDLQDLLSRVGAGQDLKATFIRGGGKCELSIRIGERPLR